MQGTLRRLRPRLTRRSRFPRGSDGGGRHRVVVVGGGFGGLPAARYLGKLPVDVTLVDRRNHHLFQPLLYHVATGILAPGQIAPPLRHVMRRDKNVVVELAEVTDFDLERRVVTAVRPLGDTLELPYDTLIVAAGVSQSYFGHDEFGMFAPGMKTMDDALELRRRIFGAFEMAETARDEQERLEWLTIVVVGAGPTGVELAGQMRELAARSLRREFRRFDPRSVRVVILDAGKEPLAALGEKLGKRAARTLEKMNIELHLGARVTGIDQFGVDFSVGDTKERIETRTVVWAAGVQASPLAQKLADAAGAETDRAGRILVNDDLTVPGHPEVFALGDMTALHDLPGVAEVAMQGGLHAANSIRRRLAKDEEAAAFRYRDLGSVASIGRFRAEFSRGRIRLSGFPAWVIWLFVHLAAINGFANRITTLFRWVLSMGGRARAERVISVGHTGGDLSTPGSSSFPLPAAGLYTERRPADGE